MHISFTTTHCDGISAPIAAGLIRCSILCFIGSTTRAICATRGWSLNQRRFLTRRGMQANSRQRSEEHTSELQSLMRSSYAVFCLKKKKIQNKKSTQTVVYIITYTHLYIESYKH